MSEVVQVEGLDIKQGKLPSSTVSVLCIKCSPVKPAHFVSEMDPSKKARIITIIKVAEKLPDLSMWEDL